MIKENLEKFSRSISKKRVLFDLFLAGVAVSIYYASRNERIRHLINEEARFWLLDKGSNLAEIIRKKLGKG